MWKRRPAAEHGFRHVRDRPIRLGRDDGWVVGWNLRDEARIDIQRLGDHVSWAVRQPIGQIHLLKPIRLEDLPCTIKIGGSVPNILDIVAKRLLDVADVAGMEVCGHRLRPGVEDGLRRSFSLHPVIPFVGIGMPMHSSQAARFDRHRLLQQCFRRKGSWCCPASFAPIRSSSQRIRLELVTLENVGIWRLACCRRHLGLDPASGGYAGVLLW